MSSVSEELKNEAVELVKYFAKNAIAVWDRREAQKFVAKLPKKVVFHKGVKSKSIAREVASKKRFPDEDDE